MEENPPEQSSRPPADRQVPQSRTPQAAFSTPEEPQPEAKPTQRGQPRTDAKAAPPVTFQSPSGDPAEQAAPAKKQAAPAKPARPAKQAAGGRKPAPPKQATPAAAAEPVTPTAGPGETAVPTAGSGESAAGAPRAKAAPRKAPTRKTGLAARTEITPAKAFPQQSTGAKKPLTPAKPDAPAKRATPARPQGSGLQDAAAKLPDLRGASLKPQPPRQNIGAREVTGESVLDAPRRSNRTAGTPRTKTPAPAPEASTTASTSKEAKGAEASIGVVAGQVRRTVTDAWGRVAADPGHAPELLALTAVQAIGPRADGWARDVRESYPHANADGVARLAVRQFSRRSGVAGALAAMAGGYAPLALWGVGAYHHAELVLHVAAAYGRDPVDPARAVELLVLTRVHPTREDAEAAVEAALASAPELTAFGAAWRLGRAFAVHAGGWAALRRLVPGGSLVAAAVTGHAATEMLGVRATTFYRGARQHGAGPA